jgi:hypothetical protein
MIAGCGLPHDRTEQQHRCHPGLDPGSKGIHAADYPAINEKTDSEIT